jgi:hypothetical protein
MVLTTLSVTQNMQDQVIEESVNDKFNTVWKETAMPYFELQYRHLLGVTEGKLKKPKSCDL